jgi:hypothetical protein
MRLWVINRLILLGIFVLTSQSFAESYWFYGVDSFLKGLELPFHNHIEEVTPSKNLLIDRAKNTFESADNERPSFYMDTDQDSLASLSKQLSKKGKYRQLLDFFYKITNHDTDHHVRVVLDSHLLDLIDVDHLIQNYFTFFHYKITIKADSLRKDEELMKSLITQVTPFMDTSSLKKLTEKIKSSPTLDFDRYLLPTFSRKALNTFSSDKGLNCFHSALAFQDPMIPSNPYLHPLRHKGHNWQMINNDELWRVLKHGFYEVDAEKTPLKYGDILVFFDKPQNVKDSSFVDYRWLKHATVYLFGNFTFSKGSKSANSTYTVNTLSEEFSKWRSLLKNPAIKIFRKSLFRVKRLPYADQHEWLH